MILLHNNNNLDICWWPDNTFMDNQLLQEILQNSDTIHTKFGIWCHLEQLHPKF